jgi:Ulp1 family protease
VRQRADKLIAHAKGMCANGLGNAIVAEHERLSLRAKSLVRMDEGVWLDDDCMDLYMYLLQARPHSSVKAVVGTRIMSRQAK